ncbi:MAG: ABC transporter ATP-binding protein [Phycisphaerae bacterium]|jgi:phospholipid/cholesterol/gamma-HCH transport system ATP-binding protein
MPPEIQNPDDDKTLVRVSGLVKRFEDRIILDHISLEVRRGETLVIMGRSGCGKSTLLRTMIGSVWPEEGQVELFGGKLADLGEQQLDSMRKRFGVLFQSGALFNSMTIGDNVALPLREHTDLDEDTIDIIVRIKLELVGLRESVDLMPAELSGGMRKRAGLARAIALDPEILFYDEPSAGLDPVTSGQIDRLMMDLAHRLGVTSVVVTHEMESAFRIADRVAWMEAGSIPRIGTAREFQAIRDSERVEDPVDQKVQRFLRGQEPDEQGKEDGEDNYEHDILGAAEG